MLESKHLRKTKRKNMNLVLELKNGDEKLLKALKSIVNLHPNAKLRVKKKKELTINGYTKEFEESVLEALREVEEERRKGTLKTYKNINDLRRALLS